MDRNIDRFNRIPCVRCDCSSIRAEMEKAGMCGYKSSWWTHWIHNISLCGRLVKFPHRKMSNHITRAMIMAKWSVFQVRFNFRLTEAKETNRIDVNFRLARGFMRCTNLPQGLWSHARLLQASGWMSVQFGLLWRQMRAMHPIAGLSAWNLQCIFWMHL